jgi:hypothetical protein
LELILVGESAKGVFAQNQESKLQVGFLAEYVFTIPTLVDGRIGDKFVLMETPENLDGFRIGIFSRFPFKKNFANLELSYFQGYSSFAHYDLQPEPDSLFPGGWDFLGYSGFKHRMFKLSVGYGFTVFKNFTFDVGLVGIYQMKDMTSHPADTVPGQFPRNERANYLLSQAFSPFVLSGYARGSYQFGPLNIYLMIEQNLTSIFGKVRYREADYPVSVRMQLWSLGVSYTVFSKKRK